MLLYAPAVFVVGHEYQIMVAVDQESLLWVQVGEETFYDECNGVMCSKKKIHKVTIPMDTLNRVGMYTVFEREIVDRKPYHPDIKEATSHTYPFYPIPADNPVFFHIADVHNRSEEAIRTAQYARHIDMVIMNGDVQEDSSCAENINTIYEIADRVTHGSIPIVFARGNHDLRGVLADQITEYIPTKDNNTFYTFRLGAIWGIVLDCGEDKADTHPEYGGTVCCSDFRKRETAFIQNVIKHSDEEYLEKGVETRLVICHNPFVFCDHPPFDVDKQIYQKWIELLRENIHPQLMISGHMHYIELHMPGDGWSTNGDLCPVIVGTAPRYQDHLVANLIKVGKEGAQIIALNDEGTIIMNREVKFEMGE